MKKETDYFKKLRDPRWQKKKNFVLERDHYTCKMCSSTDKTLVVHHLAYNGEPWDVPMEDLITLCQECHTELEQLLKKIRRILPYRSLNVSLFCEAMEVADSETIGEILVMIFNPTILQTLKQLTLCLIKERDEGYREGKRILK